MDFLGKILFLISVTQQQVEEYLDKTYGHEYLHGVCEYWAYETNEETAERIQKLREQGSPVPLDDLVFNGAEVVEKGICALTGIEGKCRVVERVG